MTSFLKYLFQIDNYYISLCCLFCETQIERNDKAWRAWFDNDAPEEEAIPDNYSNRLDPFKQLLLVKYYYSIISYNIGHYYLLRYVTDLNKQLLIFIIQIIIIYRCLNCDRLQDLYSRSILID